MTERKYRVLTTPRSFGKSSREPIDILERAGCEVVASPSPRPVSVENLCREIADMDALIVGIDPVTGDVIRAGSRLKVISKYGVGLDNIDLEAARERGIVVTNTPGANSRAVAELTIALVFALARRIPHADRATKSGRWEKVSGVELTGRTLGLVGLGTIGGIVAGLALGVGLRVVASDPRISEETNEIEGVTLLPLDELLAKSDFVSLHVPLCDETQALINRQTLKLVKTGAYLINTSRGEVVDEDALVEALRSGRLAGAALDVYRHEPPTGSRLAELDNVIATPHMGAHTTEAVDRMGVQAARNVVSALGMRDSCAKSS